MVRDKAFKVAELRPGEAGRGVVRIDPALMEILDLRIGDIIQISGNKKTVSKVLRGDDEDANRGLIRMDGSTRRNAGTSIDERVDIKKIITKNAEKITFAPAEEIKLKGGEAYLKQTFEA
ncbi:MAG: AAA family ATPase, partial [Methanomassiliicoccaceae archaeon]|nr:AAA family ATPase [Methanomassiliicoccaceae archaeon]